MPCDGNELQLLDQRMTREPESVLNEGEGSEVRVSIHDYDEATRKFTLRQDNVEERSIE